MPIPLGILAAAGFSPAVAGGSYDLLETTVLSSNTNSVSFTGLGTYASTYQHLQVRLLARSTSTNSQINGLLRLNSDSGSNYAYHFLYADGAGVYSGAGSSQTSIELGAFVTAARSSGIFTPAVMDILDPFETKNKTVRTFLGSTEFNRIFLSSGLRNNTESLTSLTITGSAGDWAIGSRFSLYGVK